MTEQNGYEEAVLLFDADLSGIDSEYTSSDFEALIAGGATLSQFAASLVNGAFAVVGAALGVRAIVFFTIKVDENGVADSNFNLPLRYLADNAGPGPDLGAGPIRLACRGQCPVPWHSVNLWEPVSDPDSGSIELVQKVVWRNRLGLKPSIAIGSVLPQDGLELMENRLAGNGKAANLKLMETRLTETFGEEGKVNLENLIRQHNDRLSEVSEKCRTELAEQQQSYLSQIKDCRDEIQALKSALRHEQQKSRRLQALLRGDP
ncbi:MAG: hypothetical protein EP301_08895 [Gammaproteobacteria bacterium]|nr:MAG: hypothetical protein EP301_08895 [Gammaproteobacteria bacterium]